MARCVLRLANVFIELRTPKNQRNAGRVDTKNHFQVNTTTAKRYSFY